MHTLLSVLFYGVFTVAIFDFLCSLIAYGACWYNKNKFSMNPESIQYSIMLWTVTGVLHFIRTPL